MAVELHPTPKAKLPGAAWSSRSSAARSSRGEERLVEARRSRGAAGVQPRRQSLACGPRADQERRSGLRVAVIGDFGSNDAVEASVAALVRSWNPDLVATVGDNNYPNGGAETIDANIGQYYHDFIAPYSGRFGAGSPHEPLLPRRWGTTTGRRPEPTPYFDYFDLPGNERYYAVRRGAVELLLPRQRRARARRDHARLRAGTSGSGPRSPRRRRATDSCCSTTRPSLPGSTTRRRRSSGRSASGARPRCSPDTITTTSASIARACPTSSWARAASVSTSSPSIVGGSQVRLREAARRAPDRGARRAGERALRDVRTVSCSTALRCPRRASCPPRRRSSPRALAGSISPEARSGRRLALARVRRLELGHRTPRPRRSTTGSPSRRPTGLR